jgi:predicted nucleic acid-binding protein
MRIFLDANILVSVLNNEYPLFTYSSRILSLIDHPNYEVFTSPLCLAIAYYFVEKKSGNKLALKKIKLLSEKISITGITEETIKRTIQNKKIHDFEDGMQYYSAVLSKCNCIVTEALGDFYYSELEVLTAKQFLEKNF